MRLDRRLVALGLGSRREVGQAVRRGRVTVDGVSVLDPATHVPDGAALTWDGASVAAPPVLVAWHKPVGVLCTVDDPWGREGLAGVLPPAWAALHPVGRLDQDTSGLLLFSGDGGLTQRLLHPRRAVPRTYEAGVEAVPADLVPRLRGGVATADGTFTATSVAVHGVTVTLTVTEGKHRMVRRMLANAGAPVRTLHRVAYGPVVLGALPVGEARALTESEVAAVREAVA